MPKVEHPVATQAIRPGRRRCMQEAAEVVKNPYVGALLRVDVTPIHHGEGGQQPIKND